MSGARLVPNLKRVYENPSRADGFRILVDRLWPRGLSKDKAKVDLWLKDIAPGDALRKWFGHDPRKWLEFKRRYHRELAAKADLVAVIEGRMREGKVTLLFGAADAEHSNAAALIGYLERKSRGLRPARKHEGIKKAEREERR
jgi:uncharacterized protein YeaO (DUF488 family)